MFKKKVNKQNDIELERKHGRKRDNQELQHGDFETKEEIADDDKQGGHEEEDYSRRTPGSQRRGPRSREQREADLYLPIPGDPGRTYDDDDQDDQDHIDERQAEEKENKFEIQDLEVEQQRAAKGYLVGSSINTVEIKIAIWSGVKAVFYLLMCIAAIFIERNNYNLNPCVASDSGDFCLLDNRTMACVDYQDIRCQTLCSNQILANQSIIGNEGCMLLFPSNILPGQKDNQSLTVYTNSSVCYLSSFQSVCQDSTSCPSDTMEKLRQGILFVGILLIVKFGVELLQGLSLWSLADITYEDLMHKTWTQTFWLVLLRVTPFFAQILFIVIICADVYLIVTYLENYPKCKDAQNTSGARLPFFNHIQTFILTLSISLPVVLLIGTTVRLKLWIRGALFSPSRNDERRFPCGADCYSCRHTSGPQTCVSCVRCCEHCCNVLWLPCDSRKSAERVLSSCCKGFQWCCDMFWCCCLCGECWGAALENLYAYRHFIGP